MVALSNVRPGKANEDVRTVQKALIARGRRIPAGATGTFDEQTRAAYRAEQLAQGFKGADADGIPGCTSLTTLGRHAGFAVDCRGAAPPAKGGRAPAAGQQLGKVGATGNATGPHLHFEMSKSGSWSCGNVEKPDW